MSGDVAVTGVPAPVAEAVRAVYLRCGGANLAGSILEAAREGNEALRGYFEWDDTEAAEQWRLAQAQSLVRRVKVTLIRSADTDPITVRAYIAARELPSNEAPAGSFVAIEELAGESDRQAALMQSIARDMARLRAKYRHVGDFLQIASELLAEE